MTYYFDQIEQIAQKSRSDLVKTDHLFYELYTKNRSHFNITIAKKLDETIDGEQLEFVLSTLVKQEWIIPLFTIRCKECGSIVCEKEMQSIEHRSDLEGEYTCASCNNVFTIIEKDITIQYKFHQQFFPKKSKHGAIKHE
jgi:hypothetical protein